MIRETDRLWRGLAVALAFDAALVCGIVGCARHTSRPQQEPQAIPAITGTVERAAVLIGVLSTKPVYNGEVLVCPGADVDLQIAEGWGLKAGITNVTRLLSVEATRLAVIDALRNATAGFGPEDLLVVTLSGHGSRVKDYNGDEESGWDSAWCLADGPWLDDGVWATIKLLPPCRILFVADTCHAEGSWRAYVPFWDTSRPVDLDPRAGSWGGTVVQLAACREAESALGNKVGGQWHCALDDARPYGATLREWFDQAKKIVSKQTPTLSTYGPLADWMLARPPMQ